jgi:hypothetical protein
MTVPQMFNPLHYPIFIFVGSVVLFWIGARIGTIFHARYGEFDKSTLEDFKVVLGAALTLLGLIIGFTFSMAVSRYDQRKNLEEEEANAIGTEYVRAEFLPSASAARVRTLLKSYLDQRILYYTTSDGHLLDQNKVQTSRLQNEMWSATIGPTSENPTPLAALVVQGMNDVLNSQGYTQAAWWNRIPVAAWILLITIGLLCNILIGYLAHDKRAFPFWILPIFLAISLFLIADIDSPGRGVILVTPRNLESLANSLRVD